MTKQIEALKRAEDMMEFVLKYPKAVTNDKALRETLSVIREVLAEQEPVDIPALRSDHLKTMLGYKIATRYGVFENKAFQLCDEMKTLYAAPVGIEAAVLAERETSIIDVLENGFEPVKSEPVALDEVRRIAAEYAEPNSQVDSGNLYWALCEALKYAAPVSAPKREWVELTDDEILGCLLKWRRGEYELQIASAVIAAFKEKNK